ncbi:MAG: hypothetical protein NWE95_06200 [Candidatus Bathyarchaeota archaeon]|nr:hypothetical protein [Candidatus Bathyarchaeota archaeon]
MKEVTVLLSYADPLTRIVPVEQIVESFEVKTQVFEHLKDQHHRSNGKVKLNVKELLGPLQCVFVVVREFLISVCTSCGDRADAVVNARALEQLEAQMHGEYILGFFQDSSLFFAERFRVVWLDQANGVLAVMAKTRAEPSLERCQSILFLREKWQPNTVADWLRIHPNWFRLEIVWFFRVMEVRDWKRWI